MSEKIKIIYTVADGYIGKDRPKTVYAHPDDFEGCETEDDFMERCQEVVDDHFRENVFPEIDNEDDLMEVFSALRSKDSA